MHEAFRVVSPGQDHLQRLVGKLRRDARAHGPAHYPPRPYVHHQRQIQPALPGFHASDVGEPRHVGVVGAGLAPGQVFGRLAHRVRARRALPPRVAALGGFATLSWTDI